MDWYSRSMRLAQAITPDDRARMHSELTRKHRTHRELAILRAVESGVKAGHNLLKGPLEGGEVDMEDVIAAIKTERCISTLERDLGYTYLENLIGNVIRDVMGPTSGISVNEARSVFGLKPTT